MERGTTNHPVLDGAHAGVGLSQTGFYASTHIEGVRNGGGAVNFNDGPFASLSQANDVEVHVFTGEWSNGVEGLRHAPIPRGCGS